LKLNVIVTYVHVPCPLCAGDTRANVSLALDVTLKQHYIIMALYVPRYHPEILLSPFNRRSSEYETGFSVAKSTAPYVRN